MDNYPHAYITLTSILFLQLPYMLFYIMPKINFTLCPLCLFDISTNRSTASE